MTAARFLHTPSHPAQFLRALLATALTCCMGFIGVIGLIGNAGATGLQASPINISIPSKNLAGVLTLSNTGNTPLNAQVRIYKWSQSDTDEFVLQPTNELVLSPPIMQLAAGSSQEIRILRTGPAGSSEQFYRLIADELPSPTTAAPKGMQLLIRHNIPVFLNVEDRPAAQVQWRAQTAGGKTRISISNIGQTHAQIGPIWLEQNGKKTAQLSEGLTGYALPGHTLVRDFPQTLGQIIAAGVQLKAQINGSAVNISLNHD